MDSVCREKIARRRISFSVHYFFIKRTCNLLNRLVISERRQNGENVNENVDDVHIQIQCGEDVFFGTD